jgi:hypothetical protein
MINGHDLGRLIELAFDYVSAESEQQAAQFRDEAARLATIETTTLINGHDLGRLIELAFDYVSAESEQQAAQFRDEAARLATIDTTTFKMWLDFIDHIKGWNSSNGHNYPMSWASALQFLSTR